MPDSAGIPDWLLAPADDKFYAAIGRVSALASVLDVGMLPALLWLLSDEPHVVSPNKDGAELIKLCKAAAKSNASPELRKDINRVLRTAFRLRLHRNALVHSVWSRPGLGFRPDLGEQAGPEPPAIIYETDEKSLQTLIADFVTLLQDIGRVQARAHAEKEVRLRRGRPVPPA